MGVTWPDESEEMSFEAYREQLLIERMNDERAAEHVRSSKKS